MDGLLLGDRGAVQPQVRGESGAVVEEWALQDSLQVQQEMETSLSSFLRTVVLDHPSGHIQLPDEPAVAAALLRENVRCWCVEQLNAQRFTMDSLMGLAVAIGDFSDVELVSFARGLI